jgi:hypothetical protein
MMADPVNEIIDVVETEADEETEYGPEIGEPDYWIEEGSDGYHAEVNSGESGFVDVSEYSDNVFGLEAGDYEMDAVKLQRTLSAMSERSYMAPAQDGGVVLFAQDSFCYINVNDVDLESSRAEVTVRKGELDEEILEPHEPVSQGLFERVKDEVEFGEE